MTYRIILAVNYSEADKSASCMIKAFDLDAQVKVFLKRKQFSPLALQSNRIATFAIPIFVFSTACCPHRLLAVAGHHPNRSQARDDPTRCFSEITK